MYEELYDLLADPMEARNLARDPDCREIWEALRRRTDELQAAYGGPYAPARERHP